MPGQKKTPEETRKFLQNAKSDPKKGREVLLEHNPDIDIDDLSDDTVKAKIQDLIDSSSAPSNSDDELEIVSATSTPAAKIPETPLSKADTPSAAAGNAPSVPKSVRILTSEKTKKGLKFPDSTVSAATAVDDYEKYYTKKAIKEKFQAQGNSQIDFNSDDGIKQYLGGDKISDAAARSKSDSRFPIIQVSPDKEVEIKFTREGVGHDENFQTSKRDVFQSANIQLELGSDKPTFKQAFVESRIRTAEQAWISEEKKTGNKILSGHAFTVFTPERAKYKGTLAAKYHRANFSAEFHQGRQEIEETIIEASEKKDSIAPLRATKAALKHTISNTIRFGKTAEERDINKVVGQYYLATGHDLSDSQQKEDYAKSIQASRDKRKLVVVKLDREITELTTAKPEEKDDKKKVGMPTIKEIDEILEKESLTPIRRGTPYSDVNAEFVTEKLERIDLNEGEKAGFKAINEVVSAPTPFIRRTPAASTSQATAKPVATKKTLKELLMERVFRSEKRTRLHLSVRSHHRF